MVRLCGIPHIRKRIIRSLSTAVVASGLPLERGGSSVALHILLNQMADIVLSNFRLMFLYAYVSPACLAFINSGFVSPYVIIYSNKSTNQIHQSLRFIACRLNTVLHVSAILMPITTFYLYCIGMGGQRQAPTALPPGTKPGTYCTGG